MQSTRIRVAVVDDEPTMRAALEDLISGHDGLELVGSGSSATERWSWDGQYGRT